MSEYNNWSQLAEQFSGAVSEAIQTGDYTAVKELVKDTANDAIEEAHGQARQAIDSITREAGIDPQAEVRAKNLSLYETKTVTPKPNQLARVKSVGQVNGVLLTVFGSIGLGIELLVLLIRLAFVPAFGAVSGLGLFFDAIITACFGGMLYQGYNLRARVKRAARYAKLCGDKMYANIAMLAANIGKSSRFVVRDVKKMLELGMFPEGHLDRQESCLMLNDEVYNTYLEVEGARKELPDQSSQQIYIADPELEAMIEEGKDYILKLRNLNDRIEGEAISTKLYRSEQLLKDIFWQVKQHPEKREQMQRLMEYYLPTMIKLVEAYAEFDNVSTPDKDMEQAKAQIENTLDTINEAFAELLNNLFRDRVFDVTTDAQVLQTMLAKEGLKKNEFKKQEETLNE